MKNEQLWAMPLPKGQRLAVSHPLETDCPGVLDLLDSGCSDGGRACMVRGFSLYYGAYYQKLLVLSESVVDGECLKSSITKGLSQTIEACDLTLFMSKFCLGTCLWNQVSAGSKFAKLSAAGDLGNGLRGVANQVELLGSNLEEPVAVGRFQLNSTVGDVSIAHWGFDDQQKSWVGIGNQSTIPRPVRLVTVGGKGNLEVDGFLLVEI
ncbi:hypothetical protein BY996DRAFT_6411140 [Phakopsora pachyrhizi]|nr:hypothetical protein BY996DRAFT_6411140 [Phakopsora pachyrhizi]